MPSQASAHVTGGLAAYQRFLSVRDGDPDLAHHTLSRREAFFRDLDRRPVRSAYRPCRERFLGSFARASPAADLDARMLWLLATARSNQAERFAVGLAELYGRMQTGEDERVLLHIHLQETYHTRILADVVALFGLPVPLRPPDRFVRMLIHCLVFTPPRWHLPLTGASEMVGCVVFRALRDRGRELFAGEPEVADRIRTLFDEILGDEIGHVGYIAAKLGPRQRRLMRQLYTLLGPRLLTQMAELELLYPRREWTRRLRAFDIEEMLAECPGTAFAAARV
jgi:hypothetical protein